MLNKEILIQIATLVLASTPLSLIIITKINRLLSKLDPLLGNTTTICTNIAGVLTKKDLMVRSIFFDQFKVTAEDSQNFLKMENIETKEQVLLEEKGLGKEQIIKFAAIAMNLCRYEKLRDIEKIIIDFFTKCDISKGQIKHDYEVIQEIPALKEKRMSTVVTIKTDTKEIFAFSKGHPTEILEKCTKIYVHNRKIELNYQNRRKIRKKIQELINNGQKVLATAIKPLPLKRQSHYSESFAETDMTLLAIIGVTEPLRIDLEESIKMAKSAGIKTYILTETKEKKAVAIGKQLELINPQYFEVISGIFLKEINDQKLEKMLANKEKDYIFSDLKEEDKLRIMSELKKQGETIAIAEESYKKIIEGIKKGRTMNGNFKKYSIHALSCKIAEIILVLTGILLNGLSPLSIAVIIILDIAINLILELSLMEDGTEEEVMSTKYHPSNTNILRWKNFAPSLSKGIIIGILITTLYVWNLLRYGWEYGERIGITEPIYFKSTAFVLGLFIAMQIANAIELRHEKKSLLQTGIFSNPYLLATSVITILISYMLFRFEFLTEKLRLGNNSFLDWKIILFTVLIFILISEFGKFIKRNKDGVKNT